MKKVLSTKKKQGSKGLKDSKEEICTQVSKPTIEIVNLGDTQDL
jgi:hypothetical protein